MQQSLADIRTDYSKNELLEGGALTENPNVLFQAWLDDAIAEMQMDANAMTLSTVDASMRPHSRIVLLKNFTQDGLTWFTNYQSHKGQELAGNPFAALQFHWVALQRVVRIEGMVEKVSDAESDAYFASRPLASRLGAWASEQSAVVASRQALDEAYEETKKRFEGKENPPRPPHWGGYRLTPVLWEFWQGRPSRLHDRLLFTRDDVAQSKWTLQRLAP